MSSNGIMKSFEGLSLSSENTMDYGLETESAGVCDLLGIPLELRDPIYEMLLTTPCGTKLDPTVYSLKFNLHPAILRVSKQISAEASRVLYQDNEFIVFKVTGLRLLLNWTPQFNRLPETQIARQ
jgi:hypothetical protein